MASVVQGETGQHKSGAAQPLGVFGSLEFATNAPAGTEQWDKVQKRIAAEQPLYHDCDEAKSTCPAPLARWRNNLKEWKSRDQVQQLELVNGYVNHTIRYTSDEVAFGRADYWASPAESLKGRGDCEDYAIAKYASLLALGYTDAQLRIVIVKDTRKDLGHAVLSVTISGGMYILDNQNAYPVLQQHIAYYQPLYSMNARGHWLNIATRQIKAKPADSVVAALDASLDQKYALSEEPYGPPNAPTLHGTISDESTPTLVANLTLHPSYADADLAPASGVGLMAIAVNNGAQEDRR